MRNRIYDAAVTFGRIPQIFPESAEPIVRSSSSPILVDVEGTQALTIATKVAPPMSGFFPIGGIVEDCLVSIANNRGGINAATLKLLADGGGHTRLGEHNVLKQLLSSGLPLWSLSTISKFIPMAAVAEEADRLGYKVPSIYRTDEAKRGDLFRRTFSAAHLFNYEPSPDFVPE